MPEPQRLDCDGAGTSGFAVLSGIIELVGLIVFTGFRGAWPLFPSAM